MVNHCVKTKEYFQDLLASQVLRHLGVSHLPPVAPQLAFSAKVFGQKVFIGVEWISILPIQPFWVIFDIPSVSF